MATIIAIGIAGWLGFNGCLLGFLIWRRCCHAKSVRLRFFKTANVLQDDLALMRQPTLIRAWMQPWDGRLH
jgi:hypothetical protein